MLNIIVVILVVYISIRFCMIVRERLLLMRNNVDKETTYYMSIQNRGGLSRVIKLVTTAEINDNVAEILIHNVIDSMSWDYMEYKLSGGVVLSTEQGNEYIISLEESNRINEVNIGNEFTRYIV